MASAVLIPQVSQLERETVSKIRWHLFPFMMIGMATCFMDRVNIGFAALQMNADLKLGPAAFGFGAGIFFLAYFLFEVPSTMIMAKVGARVWLARIMFSWGLIAACTAFVRGAHGLYLVRFLLGVAEAGFFPGLVLYITYWFRGRHHAQAVSWILIGSTVGSTVAGPLSGWLLGWNSWGLRGWQWLFIIEGLIPILFSLVLLCAWTDSPEKAKWLTPEQKKWIAGELAAEKAGKDTVHGRNVWRSLTRPGTLVLFLAYLLHGIGNLGLMMWMPQLIKSVGKTLTPMGVGLLTMVPFAFIIIALLFWSWHSDKTGERHWHVVGAALLGACGLFMFPFVTSVPLAVLAICIAVGGLGGAQATFWRAGTALLGPKEAAAGFALINAGSSLGGFLGPYMAGIAKQATGDFRASLFILAAGPLLLAVIMHFFFVKTGTGNEKVEAKATAASA